MPYELATWCSSERDFSQCKVVLVSRWREYTRRSSSPATATTGETYVSAFFESLKCFHISSLCFSKRSASTLASFSRLVLRMALLRIELSKACRKSFESSRRFFMMRSRSLSLMRVCACAEWNGASVRTTKQAAIQTIRFSRIGLFSNRFLMRLVPATASLLFRGPKARRGMPDQNKQSPSKDKDIGPSGQAGSLCTSQRKHDTLKASGGDHAQNCTPPLPRSARRSGRAGCRNLRPLHEDPRQCPQHVPHHGAPARNSGDHDCALRGRPEHRHAAPEAEGAGHRPHLAAQ